MRREAEEIGFQGAVTRLGIARVLEIFCWDQHLVDIVVAAAVPAAAVVVVAVVFVDVDVVVAVVFVVVVAAAPVAALMMMAEAEEDELYSDLILHFAMGADPENLAAVEGRGYEDVGDNEVRGRVDQQAQVDQREEGRVAPHSHLGTGADCNHSEGPA